jgi:beta-galactosidase
VYEPGELKVVAYKNGKQWATDSVKTAGAAAKLILTPDRSTIANDGKDLSFITLTVADKDAQIVPRSMNLIHFEISGPGEIIATDNGDPTDMAAFPSKDRKAFNGLALAIVRAKQKGGIIVMAKSDGLEQARITVVAK